MLPSTDFEDFFENGDFALHIVGSDGTISSFAPTEPSQSSSAIRRRNMSATTSASFMPMRLR